MTYKYIADMLCQTEMARTKDVKLFLAWERGEISTYKCMYEFLKNNKRSFIDYINSADFENWLNSLGYIRGESNGKKIQK